MSKRISAIIDEDSSDDVAMNLTPLIDVVFVVLIMFILVAPLVEIDRIQLAGAPIEKLPDQLSLQDGLSIKIHVYPDNTIWFNGTPLSIEELPFELKSCYQTAPSACPQLYHDKKAFFGTYQSVKNAVESAGFSSIDVILKSE